MRLEHEQKQLIKGAGVVVVVRWHLFLILTLYFMNYTIYAENSRFAFVFSHI